MKSFVFLAHQVPVVMGLEFNTEIYDDSAQDWRTYMDIPNNNWYSAGCFIQHPVIY